jgi:hypothetical protein
MRIVLMCERVEQVSNGLFRVRFRGFPNGPEFIDAELDCPAVPGQKYHLLLKGMFPGYPEGSTSSAPCLSDLLAFHARQALRATDLQTEIGTDDTI